jgi:hypothetical protein
MAEFSERLLTSADIQTFAADYKQIHFLASHLLRPVSSYEEQFQYVESKTEN